MGPNIEYYSFLGANLPCPVRQPARFAHCYEKAVGCAASYDVAVGYV